jgi:hypothetical protein
MLACDGDGDCRNGYACVDMGQRNPWGALVVDQGRGTRVCTLPPPEAPTGQSDVCALSPLAGAAGETRDAGPDAAPRRDGGE